MDRAGSSETSEHPRLLEDNLRKKISSLHRELSETKGQLVECRKRSILIEQLYSKTKDINDELQKEIETLSKLVENYKKKHKLTKKNVSTQVFDYDIIAEMPQEEIHRNLELQPKDKEVTHLQTTGFVQQKCCEYEQEINSDWVQTDQNSSDQEEDGELKEESVSVAESVRQAVESALQQNDYVYDETSGMYYDHASGYYYDAENKLFYEPRQGIYYTYDAENQSYHEHSRVDLNQYYGNQGIEESEINRKRQLATENEGDVEEKNTKSKKKQKIKAAKAVSYSSGAHTYSKDLKDRRVTEKDILLATLKFEGKIQSTTEFDTTTACDDYFKNECKENIEWRQNSNDYYDKSQYEQEIDMRNSADTQNSAYMGQNITISLSQSEEKPFIGPVIPTELLKGQFKNEEKSSFCDSHECKAETNTCETAFIGPVKPDEENIEMDVINSGNYASSKKYNGFESSNINPLCDENIIETEIDDTKDKNNESDVSMQIKQECFSSKEVDEKQNDIDNEEIDIEEGEISDSECEQEAKTENDKTAGYEILVFEGKTEKLRNTVIETGEISREDSESDCLSENEENTQIHGSQQYPPCIRLMVQTSEYLSPGSLYIVTCSGATIGREEGLGHAVLIPDINVSKMHCSLSYSEVLRAYLIKDHASVHGTLLNGQRLSKSKKMSDMFRVEHLDKLVIADTVFSCHIHAGNDTCRECEPGVVQNVEAQKSSTIVYSKAQKEQLRRQEMKEIRRKYGLQGDQYRSQAAAISSEYRDKADERRRTVGSDNPYEKDDVTASVHVPISERNVGHKLLTKLGWKEGQGLGKTADAITEPVLATIRSHQSAGLGSFTSVSHSLDSVNDARRSSRWVKARSRYQGDQSGRDQRGNNKRMTFVQGATLAPGNNQLQTETDKT